MRTRSLCFGLIILLFPCIASGQWVLTNSPPLGSHLTAYPKIDAPSGWCILASMRDSGITVSQNNGDTWSVMNQSFKLVSVLRANVDPLQTTILVGTDSYGVYKSTDGGATWAKANEGLTTPYVLDLYVDRTRDTTFLFAATHPANATPGGLYRSTNLGASWVHAGTPTSTYVTRVVADLSQICIGTYFSGILWSYLRPGSAWYPCNTGISRYAYITGLAYSGSAMIAAADSNGPLPQKVDTFGVFKSTTLGSSWSQVTSGLSSRRARNLLWTGGPLFLTTNSGVYYSVNEGATWNNFGSGLGGSIPYELSWTGKYLLASNSLGVWRRPMTDLPALLWLPQAAPPGHQNGGVCFVTPDTGWAVGTFGSILKTTNGGLTWWRQATGATSTLNAVAFVDRFTGWAAGTEGTILHTTDGGTSWSEQHIGSTEFRAISFASRDTGWIVGHQIGMAGVVLKTTDGGTWVKKGSSNTGLWAVCALSSRIVCAGGGYESDVQYLRTFLRTTDGGETWNTTTSTGSTITAMAFGDAENGLAVGRGGTVRKSTDGGITWIAAAGNAPGNLNAVCFADKNHAWAVGDNGLIFAMTPGGEGSQIAGTAEDLFAVTFVTSTKGWIVGSRGSILRYRSFGEDAVDDAAAEIPKVWTLSQNYPNPFNPSTTIKYDLPRASNVTLTVYDMLGREVSVLVNERREAGFHEVKFDGTNLASGVYFYRIEAGSFVQTRKLLLIR